MDHILVIEDTDSLREVLCSVLESEGYAVTGTPSAEEGLKLLKDNSFSLVLTDLKLPKMSGIDFLKESTAIDKATPVVVMTAYGSINTAVEAMKLGATDFITKPFEPTALCSLLQQVSEHRRVIDRSFGSGHRPLRKIITHSPKMLAVLEEARKVAPLRTPVLILGESGTGKELLARFIHQQSPRIDNQFIAVNCGSMPEELLESEFFGHELGAFTGATEARTGLFEVADKGTIFLDEIGNMPYQLQVKLLRTLQEQEVKRLGSTKVTQVDVRVVSATNCKIDEAIKSGTFREDLYYRLGVFVIDLPPLRERPEDISLLVNYFLKTLPVADDEQPRQITAKAMKLLESYNWPGNIRELENAIERALILTDGIIDENCLELGSKGETTSQTTTSQNLHEVSLCAAKSAEVEAIITALRQSRGNKSQAARTLGVSYKTLLNKIKHYCLDKAFQADA